MFEHSLIDLEAKQQPRQRRWISLPIAIALHVVGLTAFAFASYWTVGAVPEPSMNLVFLDLAPLPELPAGGGGRLKPAPRPERPRTEPPRPSHRVQPTVESVPDEVPDPATTTEVEALLPAVDTGDDAAGGGDPDLPPGPGIGPGPGGPGTGPGGSGEGDGPGIGGGDTPPIRFTVGMTKPEPIHQVKPRYTELARRAGVQGTVIVEAIIDEQGNVDNVRVLRGLPMGLDREAVAAVEQWKFKPARLANRPVRVYFTLTVHFTIQR